MATLITFKAHLIAKGFTQVPQWNFNETFSPLFNPHHLITLFVVVTCNWTFRPLGIKNVSLHLNETMHMKNHLGFIIIHFQIMFAFYGFLSIASTMLPKLCSVNFPNFVFSLSFNAIRLPLHFFQIKKNHSLCCY